MGIAGAVLVAKWSYGLLKQTLAVLLDRQEPHLAQEIREAVAGLEVDLSDLHVWSISPGTYAAIVGVVTEPGDGASGPAASNAGDVARAIRERLTEHEELAHLSVAVRAADGSGLSS